MISFLLWDLDHPSETDLAVVAPSTLDNTREKQTIPDELKPPPVDKPTGDNVAEPEPAEESKIAEAEAAITATTADDSTLPQTSTTQDAVEKESTRVLLLPAPSDELTRNWRLSGVARVEGEYVALITDSTGSITRRVSSSGRVDGWRLIDAGPGYAVVENDGEEVRLEIGS